MRLKKLEYTSIFVRTISIKWHVCIQGWFIFCEHIHVCICSDWLEQDPSKNSIHVLCNTVSANFLDTRFSDWVLTQVPTRFLKALLLGQSDVTLVKQRYILNFILHFAASCSVLKFTLSLSRGNCSVLKFIMTQLWQLFRTKVHTDSQPWQLFCTKVHTDSQPWQLYCTKVHNDSAVAIVLY